MLLSIIIRIEHYFIVSGVERKFVAIKAINDTIFQSINEPEKGARPCYRMVKNIKIYY